MVMAICTVCNIELTSSNRSKAGPNKYRNVCKPCRSKHTIARQASDIPKRRAYATLYLRMIGKVKQYPCENCDQLCHKEYGRAFCSDICRFIAYIDTETSSDCWLWKGGKNRRGYGKFGLNRKTVVASRTSYQFFNGKIDTGMLVCHSCDNPPCVNPGHLWLGTGSDNQQDSLKKGRHHWQNINKKG